MAAAMPALPTDLLLDGLSTSVLLAGPDGRLRYLNAAAEDLLGISAARSIGQPLADWLGVDSPVAELILRCGAQARAYTRREVPLDVPAGRRVVDCQVTWSGRDDDPAVIIELHDAEPRVRVRRDSQLAAQRDVNRRMIRQLAHEVRNPLGGLRGAAQLLDRALPDPALAEYTQVIIAEADRLRDLVDQLLGPGHAIRRTQCNVHELLQHVHRLLVAEAPPGVRLERDYDPSLPALSLDRGRMIQAFLNLAQNALQAVGDSGRIVLRTRARSNVTLGGIRHRLIAIIEFEDDGPGIAEEMQETIFYPLVSGRDGGTGLGLPLAQELVNGHGGLVEFDSRPGRTVFRVGLPMQEGAAHG